MSDPVNQIVSDALGVAKQAADSVLAAAQSAAQTQAGQQVIASAEQTANVALDVATQAALQAISQKTGLPLETTSLAVHALASHFGIGSATELLAKLKSLHQ